MEPRELRDTAKEHATALIGKRVESVSALSRDGDDAWLIRVEVLELERVPNTMDLLASYEIKLSDDGELLGFQRGRRYHRAAEDDGRE
jgi:hypothetical protein